MSEPADISVNAGASSGVDMNRAQPLVQDVLAGLAAMTSDLGPKHDALPLSVMAMALQMICLQMKTLSAPETGRYLRAVADLVDPPVAKQRTRGRHSFLRDAELRRRDALNVLLADHAAQRKALNGTAKGAGT